MLLTPQKGISAKEWCWFWSIILFQFSASLHWSLHTHSLSNDENLQFGAMQEISVSLKTYQTTRGWLTFCHLLQGANLSKWPSPSSRLVFTQPVKAPHQKRLTQLPSSASSGASEAKQVCCCLKVSMQTIYYFIQNVSSLWGIPFSLFLYLEENVFAMQGPHMF